MERITNKKQRDKIKKTKMFKTKKASQLSVKQRTELLMNIAEQLGMIKENDL